MAYRWSSSELGVAVAIAIGLVGMFGPVWLSAVGYTGSGVVWGSGTSAVVAIAGSGWLWVKWRRRRREETARAAAAAEEARARAAAEAARAAERARYVPAPAFKIGPGAQRVRFSNNVSRGAPIADIGAGATNVTVENNLSIGTEAAPKQDKTG